MAFTGNEDHKISLQDAAKLTANYRESAGSNALLAGYFGKTALTGILNQTGCVGLRVYNGQDDSGSPTFVLVGVSSDGEDLTGGELAEYIIGCPPFCPKSSELAG